MNDTETDLTVGATEGTGDRPKKKKAAPAKKKGEGKSPKTSSSTKGKKPAPKKTVEESSGKSSTNKKPGKSSKSGKTPKTTASGAGDGGKKPGKPQKTATAGGASDGAVSDSIKTSKPFTRHPVPDDVDVSTLKPGKTYGITRIDHKSTHGYYVRVGGGMTFFSDAKYGSGPKALKAATAHRDERFAALPDWQKWSVSKRKKKAA